MKEDHAPMNKTRKVALRKHRAKARKDEAKRKALRMTAHVAARSAAAPAAPRPARPAPESGSEGWRQSEVSEQTSAVRRQ
jgi:hypothetical protein